MQLTFLGTSASEGYPDAFCACANCEQARRLGGPSLRKRSSALIDGELLIDLGPDIMAASLQHGISLATVRYAIQTHEHHDHLDPSHFSSRSPLCGVHDAPRLHYFATEQALARAARVMRADPNFSLHDPSVGDRLNLTVCAVEPFQHFEVGPYRVMSVRAYHAPETTALLYLIEKDGRTIFYGTDTGELPEVTWEALAAYAPTIDLVALDHTFGYQARSNGHMNREQFLEQVAKLRDLGLLADDARIYATHLAHHSNEVHPEVAEIAATHGYAVAYDGLTVEV